MHRLGVRHPVTAATRARPRSGILRGLCALACAAFSAFIVLAPPEARAGDIDPRLVPLLTEPAAPAAVWVTFRDKGAHGPELEALLARAAVDLSPRNRARRLKARVDPLVDVADVPVAPAYLAELAAQGFGARAVSRWLNRAAVFASGSRLRQLAALPFVARVSPVSRARVDHAPLQPDRALERSATPRTEAAGAQGIGVIDHGALETALRQINVPALHDSGYIGTGVLVCLLDAGFSWHDRHEALAGKIIAPGHRRDFVDGDTTVTDTTIGFFLTHGTQVMGCITGNKPGVYVGSGYGADFALARTENDFEERPVEMLWWGMGAEWADSLGADIISSSLGYNTFNDGIGDYTYADMNGHTTDISRAAQIAASKGILVVTSVGNTGNTGWHFLLAPADVNGDSLIAVGAVDASGAVAGFSAYGPTADGRIKPDLLAAGVNLPIVGTGRGPSGYDPASYGTATGTSLSTPLVAGLAACLMQARPAWTPKEVIAALRSTASRSARPDNHGGYGIPNGLVALRGLTAPGGTRVQLALRGPNPRAALDVTSVVFALAADAAPGSGRVRVFDVRGRVVRGLWSGALEPGQAVQVAWDGTDDAGRSVLPGMYWIELESGGEVAAERVIHLR